MCAACWRRPTVTLESFAATALSGALNSLWLAPLILLAAEAALRLRPDWPPVARYRLMQAAWLLAAVAPWAPGLEFSSDAPVETRTVIVSGQLGTFAAATTPPPTQTPLTAPPWLALLWFVGAGLGLARLASACRGVMRSKARATAGPRELNELFARRRTELGLQRRFRTLFSPEACAPLAAGWRRPAVLLPRDLPQELASDDVERLWTHEAAHLERFDDWARLLERVVRTIYFFNPAFWQASRRLDFEREAACDQWAAERLGDRRGLAEALARLLEARTTPHGLAPAAAGRPSDLERRIRMLTERNQELSARRRRLGLLAAGALAAAVVVVASAAPRIVLAQSRPTLKAVSPATPYAPQPFLLEGQGYLAQAGPEQPSQPPQPPQPPQPSVRPNPQPAPSARPAPSPRIAQNSRPAQSPQPAPRPSPAPVVVPPVPPVPPVRPNVDVTEEVEREMRFHREIQPEVEAMSRIAEEISQVVSQVNVQAVQEHAQEIHSYVEEHLAPLAQEMGRLGVRMSSLAQDSAEFQRLEAELNQLEAKLHEKEGALKQLEQRMEAAAERAKPDEAQMRALEEKLKAQEKRIEEKRKAFEAKEKTRKEKAKVKTL